MVLLENRNAALPLAAETKSVAAFGNASYDTVSGGTGSGDVNEAYTVSIAQGLGNAGYAVNADLASLYASYLKLVKAGRPAPARPFSRYQPIAELDVPEDLVESAAALADVAVVTLGRNAGEGRDRTNTEGDFKPTEAERRLIQQVASAFQARKKKAVVILNIGGSIETASFRELPDAILLAWQGGQETGNAVADILSGKVNPSGKLADTFVVDYKDVPSAKTFPGHEIPGAPEPEPPPPGTPAFFRRPKPSTITYEDGIYVGYRYYDSFGVKPAYEFGYGLSYTRFEYGSLRLSAPRFDRKLTVSVEVKNAGKVAGREVAQLYLSAPARSLDKPEQELKGFAKTKLLAPGEAQTLSFALDARSLASFDPAPSAWVAEAGRYEVRIGASSRDIRQRAGFDLAKDLLVKKEARALVPKQKIDEIKPPARR
jgi:beta-glucosidase